MLPARVFFRESVFNVRTSDGVHERHLEFLGINHLRLDTDRRSKQNFSEKKRDVKPVASIDVFYFCECSSEAQIELGCQS
jgi:hypothetical protein